MKKILVSSLVSLFFLSCSVSVPNNPSKINEDFSDLEKEYKSFSTKALSNVYVKRMFNKFLATGTANPTQVIRQLEFARYLKDIKSPSDTSYFDSLAAIISDDPTIYDKINNTSGVLDKKNGEPNFRNFIDNLNPAIPAGFKLVAKGTFNMGMTGITEPVHTVTFTRDLYMGEYEVTQGEWASVYDFAVTYDAAHSTNYSTLMGSANPSDVTKGIGSTYPVNKVNWWQVIAYCNAKSLAEGLNVAYNPVTGAFLKADGVTETLLTTEVEGYRLPTEAEWEYAARGGNGNTTNGNIYSGSNTPDLVAVYATASGTATVGSLAHNELGLHDMSGNVWEWIQDYYVDPYSNDAATDPYISSGSSRVRRGGSWGYSAGSIRSASRYSGLNPVSIANNLGFRISKTAP